MGASDASRPAAAIRASSSANSGSPADCCAIESTSARPLVGLGSLAEDGRRDGSGLPSRDGAQLDANVVASLEASGVVAPERRPSRCDDANGASGRTREKVVDPREALGVGPLGVLEDHDEGLSPRDAQSHVGEHEPQGVARAAGVVELRQRLVGRQTREELARRVRARDLAHGDKDVGRVERLLERSSLCDSCQAARDIRHDAERLALGERLASRDENLRPSRVTRDSREGLAPQPGLADARRPSDGDDDGCLVVGASLEGTDDLRELRLPSHEGRAADDLAPAAQRLADHRAAVASQLKLEASSRELRRRRVRQHLSARGVAGEGGRAVDHLPRRARAVDARAPGRDAHSGVELGDAKPEVERPRCLVAERLADAEVAHDGVPAELGRVGAARAQVCEEPLARERPWARGWQRWSSRAAYRPPCRSSYPGSRAPRRKCRCVASGSPSRPRDPPQSPVAFARPLPRRPGRSVGDVASSCARASSRRTGASSNTSARRGAGVVTRRARIAMGVGPTCGGRPVIISNSVAPSA